MIKKISILLATATVYSLSAMQPEEQPVYNRPTNYLHNHLPKELYQDLHKYIDWNVKSSLILLSLKLQAKKSQICQLILTNPNALPLYIGPQIHGDKYLGLKGNTAFVTDNSNNCIPLHGHSKQVISGSFNSCGDKIVTYSDDQTARIWDVASGRCLHVLCGARNGASFNPAGDLLITADGPWMSIWDVQSGTNIRSIKFLWDVSTPQFTQCGNAISVTMNHSQKFFQFLVHYYEMTDYQTLTIIQKAIIANAADAVRWNKSVYISKSNESEYEALPILIKEVLEKVCNVQKVETITQISYTSQIMGFLKHMWNAK